MYLCRLADRKSQADSLKSPLEVLDEALDKVIPSSFSLPVAPPRSKHKSGGK